MTKKKRVPWNKGKKGLQKAWNKNPRSFLIAELQRLYDELKKSPSANDMSKAKGYPSTTGYITEFKTWNNALRAAKIKIFRERTYTKKQLLIRLKEISEELGRTPKGRELSEPSVAPYRKIFGSYNNAINELNLKVNLRKWSKYKIIKKIKEKAKELGNTPKQCDFKSNPSSSVITRHFGSFNNGLLAAGLKTNDGFYGTIWKAWQKHCEACAKDIYGEIIKQKNLGFGKPDIYIPNKELIIEVMTSAYLNERKKEELKRYCDNKQKVEVWCIHKGEEYKRNNLKYVYAKKLKNKVSKKLAKRCDDFYYMSDEIRKEFGMYTKEELIKALHEISDKKKRSPKTSDLKYKYPSLKAYQGVFNSFPEALKQAGLKINREYRLKLPEKKIIKEYKEGKTLVKLGEKYGCSERSISNILKRHNIKRRIGADYYTGKTYEEKYGNKKAELLKQKQSEGMAGKKNPFYGRKHTEKTKKKIRETKRKNKIICH